MYTEKTPITTTTPFEHNSDGYGVDFLNHHNALKGQQAYGIIIHMDRELTSLNHHYPFKTNEPITP